MRFFKKFLLLFLGFCLSFTISCENGKKLTRKTALEIISEEHQYPLALRIPTGTMINNFYASLGPLSLGPRAQAKDMRSAESRIKNSYIYQRLKLMENEGFIVFQYLQMGGRIEKDIFWQGLFWKPVVCIFKIEIKEKSKEFLILEKEVDSVDQGLGSSIHSPKDKLFHALGDMGKKITLAFLKLGDKVITEITGIRFIDKNNAVVEYNWKFDNLTPLGEYLAQKTFKGSGFVAIVRSDNFIPYKDVLSKQIRLSEAKFVLFDDGWRMVE